MINMRLVTKGSRAVCGGWGRSRMLNWADLLLLRWAGPTACLMLLARRPTLEEVTQNSSWPQQRLYTEGTPDTKTTVGQRAVNTHKCCLASCVASMTRLCEDVWVCAQKLFLVRAQPCQSTGHETAQSNRSGFINLFVSCFSFSTVPLWDTDGVALLLHRQCLSDLAQCHHVEQQVEDIKVIKAAEQHLRPVASVGCYIQTDKTQLLTSP